MQNVSDKFLELLKGNYYTDCKLLIDGVTYDQSKIVKDSMSVTRELFANGNLSVGNCVTGELDVEIIEQSENIGTMATVIPYVRITNGTEYSEWIQQGKFYLDVRSYDAEKGTLSLTCFDSMDKLEQYYFTEDNYMTEAEWKKAKITDIKVVNAICTRIGVALESATKAIINHAYSVTYPNVGDGAMTCREIMEYIASAYAGNWTITSAGQMRLVTLNSLQDETSLLIQTDGSYIWVGGVRIIV